ncbi:MAG TPA: ATP-binding protein [Burkholderiaceae bacterium]|nr:ATP-binding protein [Burkholderiaceae bacterium]
MPTTPNQPNMPDYGEAGLTFGQFSNAANSGLALESLLEEFLISIVSMAGAQAGAVRILSDDQKFMRLIAHTGLPQTVVEAERIVKRGCGMCGVAFGENILAWVDDVKSCAQHNTETYFGQSCQRVLAISLPHGNQVLGVYNLFFESYTEIDVQTQSVLRLIAQMLGLSLYKDRLERERLRMTVLRERQEMVSEVHDAIAQTLTYVRMRLPLLNDAMLAHNDVVSQKYFSDVKKAVGVVHDNLREIMTYFRTRMDPLGLLHALKEIEENFEDRTGISLEIKNDVPHLDLTAEQEDQIFHIIQESLANISKHSMARHAVVSIAEMNDMLSFSIEDDGLGLQDPSVSTIVTAAQELIPSTHFGLDIMRGRAQKLGGHIEVSENEGGGTRVYLKIPTSSSQQATQPKQQHKVIPINGTINGAANAAKYGEYGG